MKSLKNWMVCVVFLFVSVVALTACKGVSVVPPPSEETVITERITETLRDTVFNIAPDSSYYKAWLRCVEGKVVLSTPQLKKGRHLKPPEVQIKDNILTVNCHAEAQQLFAQWKERFIEQHKQQTLKTYIPVDKPPSSWQLFQIWCGRIFLALLLLALIAWRFPIYKLIPKN